MNICFVQKKYLLRECETKGIPTDEPNEYMAEKLKWIVNFLIMNLYELDEEGICHLDDQKAIKCDLIDECINWEDISCYNVEVKDDKYIIYIDEASPYCNKFQDYLSKWLKTLGWDNFEFEINW